MTNCPIFLQLRQNFDFVVIFKNRIQQVSEQKLILGIVYRISRSILDVEQYQIYVSTRLETTVHWNELLNILYQEFTEETSVRTCK